MSKKKIRRNCICFYGQSSNDVTGSMYYVQFDGLKILLECGLYQSSSNSYLDSYKVNSEKYRFKPSEIDYVFVCHPHIDHIGALPRMVKEGFNGRIIATGNTAAIMKPLLMNSCYIVQEEARILSKKYKRDYLPLYEIDDVNKTLELVSVYDLYDTDIQIDDNLRFQWLRNSHCVGAAQLYLTLGSGNSTRRIIYTSDIGALKSNNHFVENTEIPEMYADITIMESTYGGNTKASHAKRSYDLRHFKSAVDTTLERNGCIVLPCFSFSRTQEILATLYDIYGNDPDFTAPVIVDSMLSCEISKLYGEILSGDDSKDWNSIIGWKNIKFISDTKDSQVNLADDKPKIVISSSGFCTNGRVINYLKKYLRDPNSMIIFSGFAGDNQSYLSYRIKNYRNQRYISINKERVPNRADCITLSSFSSHANQADLIHYGSSLNTKKLVLVHGSEDSKKCLSKKLHEAIEKNDKSYKVLVSNKDMVIYL